MAGMPVAGGRPPDAARHEQRRKTLHDVMELAANSSPIRWLRAGGRKGARLISGDRAIFAGDASAVSASATRRNERFALKETSWQRRPCRSTTWWRPDCSSRRR
jgi:DNA primase